MSDVKRYDIVSDSCGWWPEGSTTGDYVLYDDYEQKVAELLARITSIEREKEELKADYDLQCDCRDAYRQEKEEARDKALEDVRTKIEYEIQYDTPVLKVLAIRDIFSAMKGTKP